MKNLFNKIKNNILLFDVIFIGINIVISFILYLFNIRFRLWVIIFIILISVIGFVIGIFQLIYKSFENKKVVIIISILSAIPIIILFVIFFPFISFIAVFSYQPEHTVSLGNKKYVAVVNSFLNVNVNYYDYYGPLLMGMKVRVHGYFGKGGFDPFVNTNIADSVLYTYYDSNGKITSKETVTFIKDEDDNIIDNNSSGVDMNTSNKYNEILLPENEEILYERKFDKTIFRVGKVDNISGQNMMVNILRSTDNGENFDVVSDELIQVSNEAKFVFLNESLGFIVSNLNIYLDNSRASLYVTNNSGKTFTTSKIEYKNDKVDYITIEGLPYDDGDILKLKCSVYEVKTDGSGYQEIEILFVSNDNGLTWNVENN